MANVTLSPKSTVDTTTAQFAQHISGKVAGADIVAGQPVEIRTDDKLYPLATGPFVGIAPRTAKAGQALTVYGTGVRFHASDTNLAALVYYAGAAGTISDAATALDDQGAFIRVGLRDLMVVRTGKLA